MTKLVNLDELATPKRVLKYKGVAHDVSDLSVEKFVEFQNDFNELIDSQAEGDTSKMLSLAKRIIGNCVPTFEGTGELNLRQLMAAVQLIADVYPSADEAAGNEPSPPTQPE
jgi:hypothetical protein